MASLEIGGKGSVAEIRLDRVSRKGHLAGFVGVAARGLLDFGVGEYLIEPGASSRLEPRINQCHACYALGDTLREENGEWRVRFVGLFRSDGDSAEVRIADRPDPEGGWATIEPAASAPIVNNDFRRNTAVLDARLPRNPAETDLYYTVWKDGRDVTGDPRLGTDAVGIGTGQVGEVPSTGEYVGRLPRLSAPYKLCGLSCHAIHGGGPNLPDAGRGGGFFVHDQPTPGAYRHLEDYGFQIMMWEDDVWYMELLLYPPSADDAYKIVTTTLCGPTTRWQMMRHWNTINPGDHDYGMDDVKGPEQIAIRTHEDLGQDRDYMRRNFQVVHHLVTGEEAPSGTANPKKWRRWKMPNRDFSLLILDSRLWRSSQDTNIWDDQGWGNKTSLYTREDVTRSLLGEEQFAWLRETILTDSSPLICLTGINGLHTIWIGDGRRPRCQDRTGRARQGGRGLCRVGDGRCEPGSGGVGIAPRSDDRVRRRARRHDPQEPRAQGLRVLVRPDRAQRRTRGQGRIRPSNEGFRRSRGRDQGALSPELRHSGPAQARTDRSTGTSWKWSSTPVRRIRSSVCGCATWSTRLRRSRAAEGQCRNRRPEPDGCRPVRCPPPRSCRTRRFCCQRWMVGLCREPERSPTAHCRSRALLRSSRASRSSPPPVRETRSWRSVWSPGLGRDRGRPRHRLGARLPLGTARTRAKRAGGTRLAADRAPPVRYAGDCGRGRDCGVETWRGRAECLREGGFCVFFGPIIMVMVRPRCAAASRDCRLRQRRLPACGESARRSSGA